MTNTCEPTLGSSWMSPSITHLTLSVGLVRFGVSEMVPLRAIRYVDPGLGKVGVGLANLSMP
ncbi:MAG: hypothetical protein R3B48_04625 [Kofleriaceae bacterium]